MRPRVCRHVQYRYEKQERERLQGEIAVTPLREALEEHAKQQEHEKHGGRQEGLILFRPRYDNVYFVSCICSEKDPWSKSEKKEATKLRICRRRQRSS